MGVPEPAGVLVGEKGRSVEQCRLAHDDGAACAGPGTGCTHHQNWNRNHAGSAGHSHARATYTGATQPPSRHQVTQHVWALITCSQTT